MSTPDAFDPSRYLTLVSGKEYLEVKWRLVWFRSEHPEGTIKTELLSHDAQRREAVVHATVSIPDGGTGTGLGMENQQGFNDYLPKAETAAIGRALAALGYGTQFCGDFEFGAAAGRVVDSPVQQAQPRQQNTNPRPMSSTPEGFGHQAQQPPRQQYGQQTGNLASDKQLGMIRGIAKEQGLGSADLAAIIADVTGGTMDDLTTRTASTVIDRLRAGLQQRPQPTHPEMQYQRPQQERQQYSGQGMRNPDALATEKQKNLIAVKWRQKFPTNEFEASKNVWLEANMGTDWNSMTMKQASDFIEAFNDPDMVPF